MQYFPNQNNTFLQQLNSYQSSFLLIHGSSLVILLQLYPTIMYNKYKSKISMTKYPPIWRGYLCDMLDDQYGTEVVIHLQFSTFNVINQPGGNKIHGEGKCEEGNFTINGTQKDHNHFFCQYKSEKRTLFVQGELKEGTAFEAMWGPTVQEIGSGVFVVQKIEQKQGWNGFYNQYGIDFQMKFDKLSIDIVPNGKVEGHGKDGVGAFDIKGSFETANNEVLFTKTYQNAHSWTYWGKVQNKEIKGEWGFQKGDGQGTFRLYYLE